MPSLSAKLSKESCIRSSKIGTTSFLFIVVIEDHRTIMRPDVGPLPVELGWIVAVPEDFEKIFVGDSGRVVFDLHDLGMAGAVGANIFVRRFVEMAARIADRRGNHSGDATNRQLTRNTPPRTLPFSWWRLSS